MSTPTAGWPFPTLVSALARAGWADLDTGAAQGIRSTLRALCDLLPHTSAVGQVTLAQVADAAGLSQKWTSRCLRYLEQTGIIAWTRGQILAGRPTPGVIRVSKRILADLIAKARGQIDERRRARSAETGRRIRETLRTGIALNRPTQPRTPWYARPQTPDKRKPLSDHAELRSPLPPTGEETEASGPVVRPPGYWKAQLKARMTGGPTP